MSKLDSLLSAVFYRRSCPEVEVLGDYSLGVLPLGQRLAVAQHLRICPHCARELTEYAAADAVPNDALAGLLDSVREGLRNVIGRVAWAELVAPTAPLPVRGTADALQTYRTGNVQIMMEVRPASTGYRRKRLLGKVEPPTAAIGADLWRGAELVASYAVASDGFFSFDKLLPGAYTLCLRQTGAEVWLEVTGLADQS